VNIRPYHPRDLNALIGLTIETFGPFYENHFRPLAGEAIFQHQHGRWADDYRAQVPVLHDPAAGKHVAVAETSDDAIAGYVAWQVDPARRHGDVVILAGACCRLLQATVSHNRWDLRATPLSRLARKSPRGSGA
jgi:hypothetical protein